MRRTIFASFILSGIFALFFTFSLIAPASAAYTGGKTVTRELAESMRALIQDPGVADAYRNKVESALAQTYDKPCLHDFATMTQALWAPAREVDAAAAQAALLTTARDKQITLLHALSSERADNAAKRDAAKNILPEKQAARATLESGFAVAVATLDAAIQNHDSLTSIDELTRKKVHTSKENIAALTQRETRIDARLQALRQASAACDTSETPDQEGNSENKNENIKENNENVDQTILNEIKSLMLELDTLTAKRDVERVELAALEQELAKSTADLAASKTALDAAREQRNRVSQDLASMKKRIAELEAEIITRNEHEKKLDQQISETNEIIADLEIKIQEQERITETISPEALAKYKALLKPYDNWGCAPGMALIEGTYCMDLYEYPNVKGQAPATDITWTDADKTCRGLGKRLCTDVEWTFTCNGPQCYERPAPADYNDRTCNLGLGRYGDVQLLPAGSRPDTPAADSAPDTAPDPEAPYACDSPYGPADLVGNAWEWIADTHKSATFHGVRIGGHTSQFEPNCGDDSWYDAPTTLPYLSFRCCADPGPATR